MLLLGWLDMIHMLLNMYDEKCMAPYAVWKPYGKLFKVYAAFEEYVFEEYVFEDQWLSASGRAMPSPAPAAISPSVLGGCSTLRVDQTVRRDR